METSIIFRTVMALANAIEAKTLIQRGIRSGNPERQDMANFF